MNKPFAIVRKLTGLNALGNPKPWKVSYGRDGRYPGVLSVVGTSYHTSHAEALANAVEWTDAAARTTPGGHRG